MQDINLFSVHSLQSPLPPVWLDHSKLRDRQDAADVAMRFQLVNSC